MMKLRKALSVTLFCLLILSALTLDKLISSSGSSAQNLQTTNLQGGQNATTAMQVGWQNKVDPGVFARAAQGQTDFLVYMAQQADLSGASALSTKEEKGRYVYERLTTVAQATQPSVTQALRLLGAEHKTFWVTNAIWVKGNLAVVQAMAMRPEVAYIYPSGKGTVKLPAKEANASGADLAAADPNPEPNLLKVNADDVWTMGYLGQGVTVAGADTGVAWTHAALKDRYRGWDGAAANHNYNWHDAIHNPNTVCPASGIEPCDDDQVLGGGHGSHTVGTMVGDDGGSNRIGMAPNAKWIACRNMNNGVGTVPMYMECMEWFIAPTDITNQNPDPTKAPHVINNSWGCVEGCPPPLLKDTLHASRMAGIFYAVSAGNDGVGEPEAPGCNTIYHPLARYQEAFTVGATSHVTDTIASFSSRGPVVGEPEAPTGMTKPNISAPGVGIRSSLRNGGYGSLSGTSMAGPHVAGMVALLISANPRLAGKVDRLEDIIEQTALKKTTTEGCGGDTSTQVPNNTYGWGRIDALAAVIEALPPDAVNDTATTIQETPVIISVLTNDTDPDNDTLTITATGPADHGVVTNNGDGTLTYTPEAGFTGNDSFTYTICAPEGCDTTSDTATVTVQVGAADCLVNFALSSAGATATGSSEYGNGGFPASSAIDGEHKGLNWGAGGGWNDNTRGVYPDSLEVAFQGSKTISQIIVYTLQNNFENPVEPTPLTPADYHGIQDFNVQYWNGSNWVTVTGGSVTGNDKAMRIFAMPLTTTTKIRVVVNNARVHFSRITELEAFGCQVP
jgi:serine protease AprX